jgi:Helicase associated domain
VNPSEAWDEGYRRLLDYVGAEGHTCVPHAYRVGAYHLGRWTYRQRLAHAKGGLEADRRRRLEQVPGWVWDPRDARWRQDYTKLQSYLACRGDARVPYATVVGGFRLGVWVAAQRTLYSKGRLDPRRQKELERLPGWVWNAREDQWERNFRHLADYARQHDGARVPVSYADERGKLGLWVHNQRCQYGRAELDPDRARRLQQLSGWTWNCSTEAR